MRERFRPQAEPQQEALNHFVTFAWQLFTR
jgi:hypothetical protein